MRRGLATAVAGVATWVCAIVFRIGAAADVDVMEPLVVARVGESPIMRASLDSALGRIGFDRIGSDDAKVRTRAEVLGQLVDEQLLRQAIERAGKSATDVEIDTFISQLETRLASERGTLDQFLAQSGRDARTLRRHVALELGVTKLVASRLTPEVIAATARRHAREFDGTLLRVSHVLLRPDAQPPEQSVARNLERASSIRSRVLQGEITFDEAARLHSAGPSRRRGGDLGYLPRTGVMDEEFSRQVFALSKGEISRPFITSSGVHLAIVTDVRPGTVPEDRVRPQLERLAGQQVLRQILERERAETRIVYGPGVAHLERDPADPSAPSKVVVEPQPVGR